MKRLHTLPSNDYLFFTAKIKKMETKLQSYIHKNYSLDSRSLALFRVYVAVILLVNFLCTRLPFFDLFHSKNGFLTFKSLINSDRFFSQTTSLNFIYPGDGFQIFLFGLAILCAVLLLIGYRTGWALFGSWILLASIHAKNPLIINSGDTLLVLILFWSLLLPLNSHFSVDKALAEKEDKPFNEFSIASFCLIGQMLMLYIFAGASKTNAVWRDGSAVYYSLMLDNFRTQWGDIILQYPELMKYLSHFTYYFFETAMPWIFVFLAWWWPIRLLLLTMMIGFHLSLSLFLELGLFAWIAMSGWLVLLPAEFWNQLNRFLPGKKRKLQVYYDEDCFFCRKGVYLIQTFLILPHVSFMKAGISPEAKKEMNKRGSWLALDEENNWHDRWQVWVLLVSRSPLIFYLAPLFRNISTLGDKIYGVVSHRRALWGKILSFFWKPPSAHTQSLHTNKNLLNILTVFFSVCFLYSVAWNIRNVNIVEYQKHFPRTWDGPGKFFHIHQHWAMFSPKPPDKTGWIILSGSTRKKYLPTETNDSKKGKKVKPESLKIDLWQGGKPVTMDRPHRYNETFPGFRHRKLIENLIDQPRGAPYLKRYLQYQCYKWNSQYRENSVKSIEFIYMEVDTPPIGKPFTEPKLRSLKKVKCPFKLVRFQEE